MQSWLFGVLAVILSSGLLYLIRAPLGKGEIRRQPMVLQSQSVPAAEESTFIPPGPVKKSVGLTVFIHGTVGSSFNLFNPFIGYYDRTNEDTFSVRALRRYRSHPAMGFDQLLGEEGLCFVNACKGDPLLASTYLIPAYDELNHLFGKTCDIQEYALFGWTGLLSNRARREAGMQLYEALVRYRDHVRKIYKVTPVIRIIAHSHGGNVALYTAQGELEKQRRLFIDSLFMFGTPMQVETAAYIASPLFRHIALGYSWGDSVQRRDFYSTSAHKSYSRMSDVMDLKKVMKNHPGCTRCDVRFAVAGEECAVCHTNMWLCGRGNSLFCWMDPLPLMILTPQIFAALEAHPVCTHALFDIKSDEEKCWLTFSQCLDYPMGKKPKTNFIKKARAFEAETEQDFDFYAVQVKEILSRWAKKMLSEWRQFDASRDVLFNRRNRDAVRASLFGLRQNP